MNLLSLLRRITLPAGRPASLLVRGYQTLLSAVIIAAVLALALTSDAFELQEGRPYKPSPAPSPASQLSSPQTRAPSSGPAPVVYYYIVSSEEQRNLVAEAMRSDAQARQAGGAAGDPRVLFFLASTVQDEAAVARIVEHETYAAASAGISFLIVDLRLPPTSSSP